ncbi:MAG: ABC transporter substrate-binding protein [Ferrimicrobium sp.]
MTAFSITGTLTEPARRIVSLAPSLTEILFFLGLESSVAGVTEQCDFPPAASQLETIGTFSQPDLERIRAVEADLVMGLDGIHHRSVDKFLEAGIPLVLFNYRTVDDIFASMEEVIRIADAEQEGTSRMQALRNRVSRVQAATSRCHGPRVFRLMIDDPIITPSATCYQTDAMRLAGAQTMALNFEEPYVSVALREIIDFDPQVIISCGREISQEVKPRCRGCQAEAPSCQREVSRLATQAGWSQTAAAKQSNIHAVPCGLLCRPGPRVVDGIEAMADLFTRHEGASFTFEAGAR